MRYTGVFYIYQMKTKLTLIILFLCCLNSFGQEIDYRVKDYYNSFLQRAISIGVDPTEFRVNLVGIYLNMETEPKDWARTYQNKSGRAFINISELATKQQLEVLVYHELTHFLLRNTNHYDEGPLLITPGSNFVFTLFQYSPEYYRSELFTWLDHNIKR